MIRGQVVSSERANVLTGIKRIPSKVDDHLLDQFRMILSHKLQASSIKLQASSLTDGEGYYRMHLEREDI